jgi:hypothetical protein
MATGGAPKQSWVVGSRNPQRVKPPTSGRTKLALLERRYADWALVVCCQGCANGGRFRWHYLMKQIGARARIGDVLSRLVCKKCGCVLVSIRPEFVGKRRD